MKTELNENNFEVQTQSGLKLIEFATPWCGFCKRQESILDEMSAVWIGQINADKNPTLVQRYNISGFPTFLIFKDGKEVKRLSGLHSKFDLMNNLMKYLDKNAVLDVEADEDF